VGVGAVVVLLAFGKGLANGFERIPSSSTADLIVAQREASMVLMSAVDEEIGDELPSCLGSMKLQEPSSALYRMQL
jgi:hypothetical protein